MIERQTINGRGAFVADFGPLKKVIFDDGEVLFLAAPAPSPDDSLPPQFQLGGDEASPDDDEARAEGRAWNRHRYKQQPVSHRQKGPLLHGRTFAAWAAYFAQSDIARVDGAIRSGLISGLDNTEIAAKVVGSMKLRGVDGVTEITRQQIARLGRVAIKRRQS